VHLGEASDRELDAAIDEILRADDPFVSNRRVATRDALVEGCRVSAGDVVVLDWRAANRDPAAFENPDAHRPEAHAAANLVYGTGPHVCPGRGLSTLELRVLVRELLAAGTLELDVRHPATREEPPVAGFRTVPVRLVGRG
jgi:cytochrome P450